MKDSKGRLVLLEDGEAWETVFNRVMSDKWFVIISPFGSSIEQRLPIIEETYYPPATDKNAGFELILMFRYGGSVALCDKKLMSAKQLSEILCLPVPENKTLIMNSLPEDDREYNINIETIHSLNAIGEARGLKRDPNYGKNKYV